jgi:FkbM family methyltransferase
MPFSRSQPSPRYRALLAEYAQMHREGERFLGLAPEQTYPGSSLLPHLVPIKRLIGASGARTILDYGSGKGLQYRPQPVVIGGRRVADGVAEFWDVDQVCCYDPAYPPHARLPDARFDGVISTDVLEHCPEEDLAWIVAELFSYAERFVYANVACYPARKRLPSGANAHVTLRPAEWWRELFAEAAQAKPGLCWELHVSERAGESLRERVFENGAERTEPGTSGADKAIVEVRFEERPMRFWADSPAAKWRAQTLFTKEPVTIEWIRGFERGSVFLDVGANVGVFTVFAAIARDARVFAFEPESQNYAALNRNIALNALDRRVTAVCAALSNVNRIGPLYLSAFAAGMSAHSFGEEVGFDLRPRRAAFVQGCASFRLDALVASGDMPVPRYVKIDVDGFEHRVIEGMRDTLRDPALRELLVEINPALAEHRELREMLGACGFRFDPAQVARSTRCSGPFEGVAEHVFRR